MRHEKISPDGRPAEMYTGKMNVLKADNRNIVLKSVRKRAGTANTAGNRQSRECSRLNMMTGMPHQEERR